MIFVGVDVGGTKTAVAVADRVGKLLSQQKRPTDVTQLVATIRDAIRAAVVDAGCACADIAAIGIGVPGMVNRVVGTVELATNLRIDRPLALGGLLAAEFNTPVLIENDARLAVLGIYPRLPIANLAYLSIGTGVAAGIILDGKLRRGRNGMAGEIGHAVIDEQGTLLEQRISGPAIVAQARDKQLAVAQAGDVYHLALAGNLVAKQIIKRVSTQIGQAIQWLFMMYDVEKVVLGGGVTRVGDAFLAPILTTLARLRTQSLLNQKLLLDNNLMLAPSGFNAGLNGAVQLAMKGKMERNEE